jgi:hypothetical protein
MNLNATAQDKVNQPQEESLPSNLRTNPVLDRGEVDEQYWRLLEASERACPLDY